MSDVPPPPDIPVQFICSLTLSIMHDPVICRDGHTYERSEITRWLAHHNSSPATGLPLSHTELTPNLSLRNSIERFVVLHKKKSANERRTVKAHVPRKHFNVEKNFECLGRGIHHSVYVRHPGTTIAICRAHVSYSPPTATPASLVIIATNPTSAVQLRRRLAYVEPYRYLLPYIGHSSDASHHYLFTEYCRFGSLKQLIRQMKENNHRLTITHILYILRQVGRGMAELVKHGVTHGTLRTSNVMVREYDISDISKTWVRVSEYGLAAAQRDDTFGSQLDGQWRHQAPEVIQRGCYSEKGDVWSLGVIAYELLSDGCVPYFHSDDHSIENQIQNVCSRKLRLERPASCRVEVWNVVEKCLAACPTERPTFMKLSAMLDELALEVGINSDALHLSMPITEARKIMETASNAEDVPRILNAMTHYPEDVDIQCTGCNTLGRLTAQDAHALELLENHRGIDLVLSLLTNHELDARIQEAGCSLLGNAARTLPNKQAIISRQGVDAVTSCMTKHAHSSNMQYYGCAALNNIGNDEATRSSISSWGVVSVLMCALNGFSSEQRVQFAACCAMQHITVDDPRRVEILTHKVLPPLIGAMERHQTYAPLQEAAFAAMNNMIAEDEPLISHISSLRYLKLITASLRRHFTEPETQYAACLLIRNISSDVSVAMSLIDSGAIPCLLLAMNGHRQDVRLQRTVCHALDRLASVNRILPTLIDQGFIPQLLEVMKRHKSDHEVQLAGCRALLHFVNAGPEVLYHVANFGGRAVARDAHKNFSWSLDVEAPCKELEAALSRPSQHNYQNNQHRLYA